MLPGVDYHSYFFAWSIMPRREEFDCICNLCSSRGVSRLEQCDTQFVFLTRGKVSMFAGLSKPAHEEY